MTIKSHPLSTFKMHCIYICEVCMLFVVIFVIQWTHKTTIYFVAGREYMS